MRKVSHMKLEEDVQIQRVDSGSYTESYIARSRKFGDMEQHQRQKKGATLFLPLDVIINVLSRVPARSLARFRCVNKQWRSVTCSCDEDDDVDDYFFSMRRKHASARPKIIDEIVRGRVVVHDLDAEADEVEDRFFDVEILARHRLSNSVKGMACAYRYDRHGSDFHLLNPTTREVSRLPSSDLGHLDLDCRLLSVGLGFDASAGIYKLVRIILYMDIGYAHILTLGGDQEWRFTSDQPPMPNVYLDGPPVCLDGVLHWSAYKRDCREKFFILAFDVKKEKFEQFIPMPPVSVSVSTTCTDFLSMDVKEWRGHICVGVQYPVIGRVEIWMLEDYTNRGWTKTCNFCVHGHDTTLRPYLFNKRELLAIKDGKILLKLVSYDDRNHIGMICCYDLKSKTLRRIYTSPSLTGRDVYIESLISPKKLLQNLSKKLQQ